jgi:hypothetical protein
MDYVKSVLLQKPTNKKQRLNDLGSTVSACQLIPDNFYARDAEQLFKKDPPIDGIEAHSDLKFLLVQVLYQFEELAFRPSLP